jgi:hypothetical protein
LDGLARPWAPLLIPDLFARLSRDVVPALDDDKIALLGYPPRAAAWTKCSESLAMRGPKPLLQVEDSLLREIKMFAHDQDRFMHFPDGVQQLSMRGGSLAKGLYYSFI